MKTKIDDNFPDRCAVMDGDKQITFWQFNSEASKIAAASAAAGVQPGDRVALCVPNSYDGLVFYFGVLKAGPGGTKIVSKG